MINSQTGRSSRQAGDTIIEVLVSIAIIALALSAGFVLSSRSFNRGIDSVERSEALALSQGQIEFLKNAQINGDIDLYIAYAQTNPTFCIDSSNGVKTKPADGSYNSACRKVNGRYDIDITYPQPNVFKLDTMWVTSGGHGTSQLTLYYKAN